MMSPTDSNWEALLRGVDCPLCAPRADNTPFWLKIGTLGVSTLYLDRNQTYRGHCQLVFDPRHVVGLESLAASEFAAFMADFEIAAKAIAGARRPDLMNYASLGNVVPHLHWHLVPRYASDPRWGGPIYTSMRADMRETRLTESEYAAIIDAIRVRLVHAA
jgi:diadenosine tetraphosphate (Ap4A) HIT family hydrolase